MKWLNCVKMKLMLVGFVAAIVMGLAGSASAWTSTDIGTPAPGIAAYDEATATWIVTGNGTDIWGGSDHFHYVCKYLKGDGEMIARVATLGPGSDPWAKAGVMIRDTLDAGARNAFVAITGGEGSGATFQCRTGIWEGDFATRYSRTLTGIAPPASVKLIRQGDTFTAYIFLDGQWQQQGKSIMVAMTDPVYIGLAVTSHRDGELRTATFDEISLVGDIYDVQLAAHNPGPDNGAVDVPVDTTLSWNPGDLAASYDVYFDTNSPPAFIGNQVETSYDPGYLKVATTYYWQVDVVDVDGTTIHTGDAWSFTTSPSNILAETRVSASSDDAEEHVLDNGKMEGLTSSDLQLGYEYRMAPNKLQTIGCRWVGVAVPKGATITKAWVQFDADDVDYDWHIPDVSVIIEGELTPNPVTFSSTAGDISSRPPTTAQVVWDIPRWMIKHEQTLDERTPDISSIIQEIVNQDGWAAGNAIVLMFRDNPAKPSQGTREAESYDGTPGNAPLLHIEATSDTAYFPDPANGAVGVATDATLRWAPGASAETHDVYFGTTSPPALIGNMTEFSFDPGPLEVDTTYYWRVDEIEADGTTKYTGDIWSFNVLSEPGLVGLWKLDETEGDIAYDSVGGLDGSLYGEPLWQPTGGKVNGALEFDGIDDYVITPFILNPSEGPFSVFAWVMGGAPGQVIISQAVGVDWLSADPSEGYLMTELKGTRRGAAALLSQIVITDGNWHHIGFVWDGSYRILYVDDIEVATDAKAQNGLASAYGALHIGAGKNLEAGSFWSGLIDDVRILRLALRTGSTTGP